MDIKQTSQKSSTHCPARQHTYTANTYEHNRLILNTLTASPNKFWMTLWSGGATEPGPGAYAANNPT